MYLNVNIDKIYAQTGFQTCFPNLHVSVLVKSLFFVTGKFFVCALWKRGICVLNACICFRSCFQIQQRAGSQVSTQQHLQHIAILKTISQLQPTAAYRSAMRSNTTTNRSHQQHTQTHTHTPTHTYTLQVGLRIPGLKEPFRTRFGKALGFGKDLG